MQFRLRTAHYTASGQHLDPGTVIGDGADVAWPQKGWSDITPDMIPLDDAAQKAFDAVWRFDATQQQFRRK